MKHALFELLTRSGLGHTYARELHLACGNVDSRRWRARELSRPLPVEVLDRSSVHDVEVEQLEQRLGD